MEGIKQTVKDEFENKKDILLTKQDKVELIEKMNTDKIVILKWLFGFWITIILMLLVNVFMKK